MKYINLGIHIDNRSPETFTKNSNCSLIFHTSERSAFKIIKKDTTNLIDVGCMNTLYLHILLYVIIAERPIFKVVEL